MLSASYIGKMVDLLKTSISSFMILVLVAVASVVVAPQVLHAKQVAGKMKISLRPNNENDNYLNSSESLNSEPQGLNKLIYNKNALSELGQKYQALQQTHEMKSHHNLNTFSDELNYNNSSREMVSSYVRAVLRGHLRNTVRNARTEIRDGLERSRHEKNQEKVETAVAVDPANQNSQADGVVAKAKSKDKKLVSVAAKKHKAEAKSNVEMKLDDILRSAWIFGENVVERHQTIGLWSDTEARLHYDLPQGTMYVNFLSSFIDGEMKYRVRSEPLPFSGGNTNNDKSKMSVSLMKNFPEITMDTGLIYGVDNSTVGANVSKRLSGPLSAQVSRSLSLRESQQTSTTVQLNVGMGF